MKKEAPAFWVSNNSPMNVTLADLALNIKAFSTVNLLDKRHYAYTLEQLRKSAASGSLFKKRNKIAVRNNPPPEPEKPLTPIARSSFFPDRSRSIYEIDETEYEELKVSDEDQKMQDELYAQENADLAEIDNQRSVINPPVNKKV